MQGYVIRLAIIALLVVLGIILEIGGFLDAEQIVAAAREMSHRWWLIVVLILAQAVLFTFALAGSLFLWVVAVLYPPLAASLILAVGATLGGLGAYWFSSYLTGDWRHRIENSRGYRMLQLQDNFFSLFAMRIFPGFPHSVINYSAGILKVDLTHFTAAAILGISLKSYLYARVIYPASGKLTLDLLLDAWIIGPLVLLSLLSLLGLRFSRTR